MTWSGPTVPRSALNGSGRYARYAVRWPAGQVHGYESLHEARRAARPCDADPYQLAGEVCLVVDDDRPPMTYTKGAAR
jgi:hypothetical protein